MTESSSSIPAPIALPFAAVGLAGGGLAADAFGLPWGDGIRWALTLVTPLSALILGFSLERHVRGGAMRTMWVLCAAVLAAAVANGMVVGSAVAVPSGILAGALVGAFCGLPFLPALALVVVFARVVGRARPNSFADGSHRRSLWVMTACAVSGGSLVSSTPWGSFVLVASILLVVITSLLDASALVRLLRIRRAWGLSSVRSTASDVSEATAVPTVDFGLGDEEREDLSLASSAYRGVDRAKRVYRGSLEGALAIARRALVIDVVALAGVTVLLFLRTTPA
jgi:hypothetical protein